jgi:membrane-bound acyltransferase YfiQ involved in biofilm formation
MINLVDVLILIWLHFVADFLLQTDYMAKNKSGSNKVLAIHCFVYSLPFIYFGWLFALVNGLAHFATDWVTSRWTTRLWKSGERHKFFVVIGLDQVIHISTLVLTLSILGN